MEEIISKNAPMTKQEALRKLKEAYEILSGNINLPSAQSSQKKVSFGMIV